MKKKLAILLATYNGEKYIQEQINSLLKQNAEDIIISIYIHDDGSTDSTIAILNEYEKRNPGKIFILDGRPTGRACNNFFFLMNSVNADYYAFCDQDDVWLPEKTSVEMNEMRKLEIDKNIPCLVWCDMKVVDHNLKTVAESHYKYSNFEPNDLRLDRCVAKSKGSGCSMLLNRSMIEKCREIKSVENVYMHDWIAIIIAKMIGRLKYIPKSLLLYRQHYNNEEGAKKMNRLIMIRNALERIKNGDEIEQSKGNMILRLKQIAALKDIPELYGQYKEFIDDVMAFVNSSISKRLAFVNKYNFYGSSKLWEYFIAVLL